MSEFRTKRKGGERTIYPVGPRTGTRTPYIKKAKHKKNGSNHEKKEMRYGGHLDSSPHLYKNGAESAERRKFEQEYGKEKGDYVYGAVVGKVKREQLAKEH